MARLSLSVFEKRILHCQVGIRGILVCCGMCREHIVKWEDAKPSGICQKFRLMLKMEKFEQC